VSRPCEHDTSCGISPSFPRLSPSRRQIGHVLLTRPPLGSVRRPSSFDLHVLGTPPAFVLSQDQTLRRVEQLIRTRSSSRTLWSAADLTFGILRSFAHVRVASPLTEGRSAFGRWARPLSRPRLSISVGCPEKSPGQLSYYSGHPSGFPGFPDLLGGSRCFDPPEQKTAAASLPRLAARAVSIRSRFQGVNRLPNNTGRSGKTVETRVSDGI
jgi:hypothetical protein